MDFLRNVSRSAVLVAAAGLATWSTGCAEQPTATPGSSTEAGSGTRPGVDVDGGKATDESPQNTNANSTAQENPPLAAPGAAPKSSGPLPPEEDNTPIPQGN